MQSYQDISREWASSTHQRKFVSYLVPIEKLPKRSLRQRFVSPSSSPICPIPTLTLSHRTPRLGLRHAAGTGVTPRASRCCSARSRKLRIWRGQDEIGLEASWDQTNPCVERVQVPSEKVHGSLDRYGWMDGWMDRWMDGWMDR